MAAPTSYTEATLKTYMNDVLGATATVLEWTIGNGNYDEAVDETLLAYGVDAISEITGRANIRKLRVIAVREVWWAVLSEIAMDYTVRDERQTLERSQAYEQAKQNFAIASSNALRYDDSYNVEGESVTFNDPYVPRDPD